jgi:hypothetical protein
VEGNCSSRSTSSSILGRRSVAARNRIEDSEYPMYIILMFLFFTLLPRRSSLAGRRAPAEQQLRKDSQHVPYGAFSAGSLWDVVKAVSLTSLIRRSSWILPKRMPDLFQEQGPTHRVSAGCGKKIRDQIPRDQVAYVSTPRAIKRRLKLSRIAGVKAAFILCRNQVFRGIPISRLSNRINQHIGQWRSEPTVQPQPA